MNKLLGKDDIKSALKRLDTLIQEEEQMATGEVMMGHVYDNVKVVLQGAHHIVIKPCTLCGTLIPIGGRETKQVTQQTASYVDEANANAFIQAGGSEDDGGDWSRAPVEASVENHTGRREALFVFFILALIIMTPAWSSSGDGGDGGGGGSALSQVQVVVNIQNHSQAISVLVILATIFAFIAYRHHRAIS